MQMRKVTLLLLAVVVVGLAASAFGQFAKTQSPFKAQHRELGYYDRQTGAFTPVKAEATGDAESAATATVTGEFEFTITITLKTAVPKNGIVGCDADAAITDPVTELSYGESGSAVATVSGTTATCKVNIPYSWILGTPTTADMVYLDYDATLIEGYEATATNGTGTIVEGIPLRTTSHDLTPIKLPASGATTTEAIAATL